VRRASHPASRRYLTDREFKQFDPLLHAIVCETPEPILIAGNRRQDWDASCSKDKLFLLGGNRFMGRPTDDLEEPGCWPETEQR
jgi:hypothetical protein